MGAVAEGSIRSSFALAEAIGGLFRDFKFFGLETGAFMGAIAERAMAGPATGTPPVGAGF